MLCIFKVSSSVLRRASLVAQMVKNLPAMQQTWVRSLGWEEPVEKGIATDSSILIWGNPQTEELGWLQSMGVPKVRHNWATKLSHSLSLGPIPLEKGKAAAEEKMGFSLSSSLRTQRPLRSSKIAKNRAEVACFLMQRLPQHCLWPFLRTACISWAILKGHGQSAWGTMGRGS